jgi:Lon protease-like protein
MNSTNEFVVVMPDGNNSHKEYGTLVKIMSVQELDPYDLIETAHGFLPRFLVHTAAIHRVRIIDTKLNKSGFLEGDILRVDDIEPENISNFQPDYVNSLMSEATKFISDLFSTAPPGARVAFERKHGKVPQDPVRFSFWIADVVPINPHTLYSLLPLVDVTRRLELICSWLNAAKISN